MSLIYHGKMAGRWRKPFSLMTVEASPGLAVDSIGHAAADMASGTAVSVPANATAGSFFDT